MVSRQEQFNEIVELYKQDKLTPAAKFALERSGMIIPYLEKETGETFNHAFSGLNGNMYEKHKDGSISNHGPYVDPNSGKMEMYKSDRRFAEDVRSWEQFIIDGKSAGGGIRGLAIEEKQPLIKNERLRSYLGKALAISAASLLLVPLAGVAQGEQQTDEGFIINEEIFTGNPDNPNDDYYQITLDINGIFDRNVTFYSYMGHNVSDLDQRFNVDDAVEVTCQKTVEDTGLLGLGTDYYYTGFNIENIDGDVLREEWKEKRDRSYMAVAIASAVVLVPLGIVLAYTTIKDKLDERKNYKEDDDEDNE